MKKTKLISTLLLAGVMAVGIGAGVNAGAVKASAAEADLPTETVLTADTLNAGITSANPWKKTFDYWSNAGTTATNVLYTQNGVVIEGGARDNSMNIINTPVSVSGGDKFEITLSVPLHTSDGGSVDGASEYVSKYVVELYQVGKAVATAWLWCDGYKAANDFVSADFGINCGVGGTAQITGVHIPRRVAEEGGGVKFGFDTAKGWYCEVGGAESAYQAVVDADGVADDKKQAYESALTAISGITDITRVRGTQKWNTDVSKARVCIKEMNGQNLCLNAENKLTVTNSFNVMQLQVKSGTQFHAKQTYSFELVGISDPTVAVASRNTATTDPTVWTYANPNASMMGDIGWGGGKIQLKLAKQDGTVVSNQVYSGTWGKESDGLIQFTVPEAGSYTLSAIFYTAKGYTTVRNLSIEAEAIPYIQAESLAKSAYFVGDEITIPSAKLMNKEGTAEITGATITSAVTFGGNAVTVADNKFTAEQAGKYTITYSTEHDGLTITSSLEATVKEDTVKSIKITTPPTKTAYYAGETFDQTGMVVTGVYESGKEAEITDYTVPAAALTAGQTSVQVSYLTYKTPVTITVSAAPTIKVQGALNGQYYVGQEIAVPSAKLVDESNQEIAGVSVAYAVTYGQESVAVTGGKFTIANAGEYKITYTATHRGREYSANITFTAQQDAVTGIEIATQPNKTSYTVGTKFDRTGMVVKAVYASGKKEEITTYTVDDKDLALSDTQITVTYMTFTAKVNIRVHAAVHIEVGNYTQSYYIGTQATVPDAKLLNEDAEIAGVTINSAVTFGGEPVAVAEGKFTVEQIGSYTITYTAEYEGEPYEYSIDITGVEDRVATIKISTPPTKTTYTEGDTFDKTGMVVTGVYESGKEAEITDFEFKLAALTPQDEAVVIRYGQCTASVAIKVEALEVASEATETPADSETEGKGCGSAVSATSLGCVVVGMCILTGVGFVASTAIKKKRQ